MTDEQQKDLEDLVEHGMRMGLVPTDGLPKECYEQYIAMYDASVRYRDRWLKPKLSEGNWRFFTIDLRQRPRVERT